MYDDSLFLTSKVARTQARHPYCLLQLCTQQVVAYAILDEHYLTVLNSLGYISLDGWRLNGIFFIAKLQRIGIESRLVNTLKFNLPLERNFADNDVSSCLRG